MENKGYTIRCGGHTYITLEWNEKFIFCLDNDMMYAEQMIFEIEKRTQMNFQDIPIKGLKEDFEGLRFFNGGISADCGGSFRCHFFKHNRKQAPAHLVNTCYPFLSSVL